MLKLLPPPDDEMRAAGLGRALVHLGRQSRGVGRSQDRGHAGRRAVPQKARRDARAPDLHVRFPGRPFHLPVDRQIRLSVALALGRRSAEIRGADRPDEQWLDEAKAKGIPEGLHRLPLSGLRPRRPRPDPRAGPTRTRFIAAYAKDMEIVVFNGHVHTTELYDVDGVKYLMLGGGGAEQDPILPGPHQHQGPGRLSAGPLLEGRAAARRSTTTSSSMSCRARRRNSPSAVSARGRRSRSRRWQLFT